MDSLNDLRTQNRDLRLKLQAALARIADLEKMLHSDNVDRTLAASRAPTSQKKLDEVKKHV